MKKEDENYEKNSSKSKGKATAVRCGLKKFYFPPQICIRHTVIELVLILVIVIALLLIFKSQLINLINTIFDKITSESSGI